MSEFIYESKDLRDEDFDNWFLTRRHVRLYEDHLELTLLTFKTNPFRQGVTLFVLDTNDETYVVRALRYLFNKWSTSLFSPLFAIDGDFIKRTIIHNLRLVLRFSDLLDHYSGYFFRRRTVITARLVDLSEDEIKLLDRWKSNFYRLYIKTHPVYILVASRRQQRVIDSFLENESNN